MVKAEMTGLLLSAVGVIFILADPMASRVDNYVTPRSTYINLFISSIFGAVWVMMNEMNSVRLPVCFLVFSQAIQMFILSSISAVLFTRF
jgi:hypothetical protein